ncbi:MAG TPA: hypothetical protein VL990_00345 [Acidobacteriaceae bacterium]|nr:hypothetical protein [Acidobacteriaceae bacterium]
MALDAGSIAIAASVGVALVARATPPTEIVRSLSHWLVCIIFTFLFSLVLGVAHNLIAVWIVQVDTYMDELEFVRKLMGQYWNLIGAAIHYTDPNLSSSDILEKIRSDEMHRQKRQRRTLTVKELLREALPVAGYGSILFFATSYVLVAICTLRLWL